MTKERRKKSNHHLRSRDTLRWFLCIGSLFLVLTFAVAIIAAVVVVVSVTVIAAVAVICILSFIIALCGRCWLVSFGVTIRKWKVIDSH